MTFKCYDGSDFELKMREFDVKTFEGESKAKNVLVIGGVHGSEQSGIEVVRKLINTLQNKKIKYTTKGV